MKTFPTLLLVIVLTGFSPNAFPQTAKPTSPQSDDKEVVKISTTLIQVDATVTDKKGNSVKDLKPGDFEIYENGKKQDITNFSFISTVSENTSAEANKLPKSNDKTAIPIPPVRLRPEQVRHTYALVVDDLGLSFTNTSYVKDTLKKFVNEQMQEGDLVAILRVGAGLGALQSFTSDKRQLLAAVNKINWNLNSRTGVNSYEAIQPSFGKELAIIRGEDPNSETIQRDNAAALDRESYRQASIAVGTLGALNYIIRGMSELPGRKSVLFFSEGFQTMDYSQKIPRTSDTFSTLRLIIEQANRASIIFYTFDPRGVTVPMKEAQDQTNPRTGTTGPTGAFNPDDFNMRELILRDTKDSLKYLAEETGGLAYVVNDLSNGIQKVIDDQSGYYLIGYQPDEDTFDAKKSKINKLTVKLNRPDLKVRYRSGFFGITDEKLKEAKMTPGQKINAALVSPFGATGVNLDIYSIFYNDEKNKNFIRSLVRIDAKDLKFTEEADGKHKATVQIVAMTFGDNGTSVDQTATEFTFQFDEKTYQRIMQKGLIYDFPLMVKKAGAYQFRIALRDVSSDKIGSASQFIEVPNIDKKELALSNLIIKNYSSDDWKKISTGQNTDAQDTNAFMDTTLRQFKAGTILTYSYMIYNAKNKAQKTQLQVQKRLFRAGKMIFQTNPIPLGLGEQKDMQRIGASGAVSLERNWQAGDYVLQIIVTDSLAKGNKQIAAQSIDFEIVN